MSEVSVYSQTIFWQYLPAVLLMVLIALGVYEMLYLINKDNIIENLFKNSRK